MIPAEHFPLEVADDLLDTAWGLVVHIVDTETAMAVAAKGQDYDVHLRVARAQLELGLPCPRPCVLDAIKLIQRFRAGEPLLSLNDEVFPPDEL